MGLVFDIETVGYKISDLSESQQEFLLRYAEKEDNEIIREEKREEAERYLSLYPFTAQVVSIGLLNTETEGLLVLYQTTKEENWKIKESKTEFIGLNESEMINLFWEYVLKSDKIITFNGRNFDIPFLMLRSAMLKIKPTINLICNRYNTTKHLDLLDQFTFYGLTRKFNLDFYCQAFNIESPKSKGISGMEVKELFRAGRNKDIAVYCAEDVISTYKLYNIWKEYLNI